MMDLHLVLTSNVYYRSTTSLVPRPLIDSTLQHGATVHFFADANPLLALTPEPTNQSLRNDDVIIVYGIIQYK